MATSEDLEVLSHTGTSHRSRNQWLLPTLTSDGYQILKGKCRVRFDAAELGRGHASVDEPVLTILILEFRVNGSMVVEVEWRIANVNVVESRESSAGAL